jgi:hypothetical protein
VTLKVRVSEESVVTTQGAFMCTCLVEAVVIVAALYKDGGRRSARVLIVVERPEISTVSCCQRSYQEFVMSPPPRSP